jgi:hypothetical protein
VHEDGTPADPPTLTTVVPNWQAGDEIPLGYKTLRVVDVSGRLGRAGARSRGH